MKKSIFTREYQVLLQVLHEAREKAGVTQVELASRLGRSQSFVSKCERGERRLDVVQFREVCHALGTTLPKIINAFERRLAKDRKLK